MVALQTTLPSTLWSTNLSMDQATYCDLHGAKIHVHPDELLIKVFDGCLAVGTGRRRLMQLPFTSMDLMMIVIFHYHHFSR